MSKKLKPAVKLPGTVEKVIPPSYSSEAEKAEIAVDGAEPLYQEIRIENVLEDEEGNKVGLKPGAQVEITIEADQQQTSPKKPSQSKTPLDSEKLETERGGSSG
jgi:hypothetical protein